MDRACKRLCERSAKQRGHLDAMARPTYRGTAPRGALARRPNRWLRACHGGPCGHIARTAPTSSLRRTPSPPAGRCGCPHLRWRSKARLAPPRLPPNFMDGCDVDQARCGGLPLEDTMPPPTCTVTLHETLLRVERPAEVDSIQAFNVLVDPAVVYTRRFEMRATTASRVEIETSRSSLRGSRDTPGTSTAVRQRSSASRRSTSTTRSGMRLPCAHGPSSS